MPESQKNRSALSFRTFVRLRRLACPLLLIPPVIAFILVPGDWAMLTAAAVFVPFWIVTAYTEWTVRKIDTHGYAAMTCPICANEGTAGRSFGWWFRCEDCGIVRPGDWFGLTYDCEPVDDDEPGD